MNRLALGTVQFGLSYGIANRVGQVTRTEARAMLELAAANGIDTLDTAIAYGESETRLGETGIHGFKLITKLPSVPDDCADVGAWVHGQLISSLSRLGVTEVYGLLLHRSQQLLGPNGSALNRALQALKANGLVQKVGVSIYSPNELEALKSKYHFDLVQAPFNLVDQRIHRSGWLQRLKDAGVEVHTRSVFLQGLLLMTELDMPVIFSQWSGLWNSWHKWLADNDTSAVHACLAFPLSFPEIDRVVVGADNVSQVAQIVDAATRQSISDLPDLQSEDENLINPALWTKL